VIKWQDDLVQMLPKRVLLLSLCVTGFLVMAVYFLTEVPVWHILTGFWIGVIVNLICFHLMVRSAKKLLDKKASGLTAFGGTGLLRRLVLYAIGLFLMAQISLYALLAAAVGLSMVGLVLKLSGISLAGQTTSSVD